MPQFVSGNTITLLRNGAEYFPALESAIDAARIEVHLQTYIFSADATGYRIAEALRRAAQRGVGVHVVVDGFGSRDYLPAALINYMRSAGVQFLVFRPEGARLLPRRNRLRRMHRKIVLIDGSIAFVGGINIIDDLYTPGHTPPRYDYAVRVTGPLVRDVCRATHRLWELMSILHYGKRWHPPAMPELGPEGGDHSAAFLVRDNLVHRTDIEEAYLEAIENAKDEIVIANAYFFPGLQFRHALYRAVERGVRVILLLQGKVEYIWLHYASRALYGSLLQAGIRIMEYRKSFMHAKVAVIDGVWATVGSSNIDPFSFILSREANIVVRDREFSATLRASLEQAMREGSVPVEVSHWERRGWALRVASWLAYGFGRVVMGVLGVTQK